MDLETVRGLTVWFQFIGAAGAALTVIIGAATVFHKRVVRPWNAKLDAISDLVGLLPAIEELVRTEMTPNGGGSMKDQLARIPVLESQLEVDRVATDARFKAMEIVVSDLTTAVHSIDRRLKVPEAQP